MTDGIEIRESTTEDYPAIRGIYCLVMKEKTSISWMKSNELHLQKQDVFGYVALKDGQITGFIIAEIQGPSFGLEKSGWVTVIGVHPHFMGTGIGKALAKSIFQYLRENGVQNVYSAMRWDAVDMMSFFISAGFGRSEFTNLEKHLDDVNPD